MNISSIAGSLSDEHKVVFITTPPITSDIFNVAHQFLTKIPGYSMIDMRLMDGYLAVFHPPFPQDIQQKLTEVLTAAENAIKVKEQQAREQANLQKQQKDAALKSYAQIFGVPIK